MPRASFPSSICPAGGQGQRRFLCRLPVWRSSALPFRPIGGAPGTAPLFLHPAARHRMPRVRSRPCEPAGSPFPFPHFPAARPYFFLYPAVLPAIPRATFPASFCPAGRQGQRRFLCRLHGRRSSALPFRPIGGAPGTAPLFLHPAARGTDAARPFPPMRTGGQSLPFSTFSPRARVVLLPLPCRPANDTAHGRRNNACRRARLRRPSAGFSNGGAARSAAVPFCPSLPRRPAVLLSLPSARTTMPHEHIPVHANRRAVPTLFHIFPARPSRASSFTLPPAIGCRVRTPRRCFPLGSSKAAFCGLLQGRRDDACRWARLRRLSAGFCRAAEAMLADGLVQGGLLRDFAGPPRRCFPLGSSEAASHRIFQRRRCAQRRRSLLSFSPPPPGERMPRVRSRPCEPAGSPFPFPHFPAARPYFFLYPAVLPAIPRATFPASICPAGRQGQRHFLCRLHGRRSSALPFRPIGGAPGTAPLFLHPAARGTDAARPFPPMRTGGQSLPFSAFSRAPESCFFLYPAARPTIPRTVAAAMLPDGLV